MIKRILIANRGEIAVRIMRSCMEMGIETVAVYSDSDKEALHVLSADYSIYIGESEPSQSYLNMDKIFYAAKESGADAIHPGYGFLAENAEFAERCEKENIIFIGPPAQVIRELGNKIVAKKIMMKSGVPVIPGMMQEVLDYKKIVEDAVKIGYPILVKAAAGGGGKGMRVVEKAEDIEDACKSASSEAASAFGNGSIFLEKYLPKSRHVEFQILADNFGNIIHLLERECSIQRRHQKIIEETPSTALTDDLRGKMGDAAVAAGKAAGYVNAGTVEFILDDKDNFYFLEVNTRLQVEHPITEMITGLDLVKYQIDIASGKKLTIKQDDVSARGHSIECRIYAEDPENGFFPSPGKIGFLKEPSGQGVRNDCGVYSGFSVPFEYDPILSKLIVHAETREDAIERMILALKNYIILGIKTPVPFLIDVMKSEPFKSGNTFTNFIDKYFLDWESSAGDFEKAGIAYIINELTCNKEKKSSGDSENSVSTPWETLGNWRI
jgi:acetyl-CoA carboxylase, biotin carboxylase subunit